MFTLVFIYCRIVIMPQMRRRRGGLVLPVQRIEPWSRESRKAAPVWKKECHSTDISESFWRNLRYCYR